VSRLRSGALAAGLLGAALAACGPSSAGGANVILISIDTLRADRLGAYGYDRPTSPELDAFARRGALFEHVVSETSWTLPAHVTMLTGLEPRSHGVVLPAYEVRADTVLLTERMRAAGYRTYASTDGGYLSRRHGFDRGFELYDDQRRGLELSLRDARTFIDRLEGDERYFVFVQTYDVHCPYEPSRRSARELRSPGAEFVETVGRCPNPDFNTADLTDAQVLFVSDRYDAGIRDADALLGEMFDWLDEEGELDDTVVVVTSDHGEAFREHGQLGHQRSVHRELLMVPLIVVGPDVEPRRIEEPVGLVELAPTLLDLAGLAPFEECDGVSLAPLLRGAGAPPERRFERHSQISYMANLDSVVTETHHLILDRDGGGVELYAWAEDPREADDLGATRAETVERLTVLIEEHLARYPHRPATPLAVSEEELEELRALGYIE
jgi:arylsulfatase A-like enzyme